MIKSLLFITLLFFVSLSYADKLIIEPEMGREPVLSTLKNAKSSIDVVMYGFTDPELTKAFMSTQHSGKNVRIIMEKTPYKNENENTITAKHLKLSKVNLQWSDKNFKLTHQKTIIADQKTALIMTFNLTRSTFNNERNFALLIDDASMVNEIENVFRADWEHKKYVTKNPDLVWSPDNSREKLLTLIKNAKSSIQIYTQEITDYKIIGALAHAAKRGISIEVLTSSKPSSKNQKKYAYLTKSGVNIHYSRKYYIHAKVIIVDHHQALLGSINLTKASIDDNRELSIITRDQDIIHALENTFYYDCGKRTSLGYRIRWWLQTLNHPRFNYYMQKLALM